MAARYYFILCWGDGSVDDDVEGSVFPKKELALRYAHRIIRELKKAGGYDEAGLVMKVCNSIGDVELDIPFSSIEI